MTKADIVNKVSKTTGVEKITVQKTVDAFMESVKSSLEKNENVYLRGFGSFIIKERAQKTARDITRNTSLVIPAHFIPAFKPAKDFASLVRKAVNPVKK
jgi:DNA-binding protein HU-beta